MSYITTSKMQGIGEVFTYMMNLFQLLAFSV